ncbi:Hypothetical protein D9617_5g068150 [Elsinoe fawcettii]|nr:Hypothetical protein D9617_5g068150 [Elsinoe fawcettii]
MIEQHIYSRGTFIWTWTPRLIICVVLFALGIRDYVILRNLYSYRYYRSSSFDEDRAAIGRSFGLIIGLTLGTIALDAGESLLFALKRLHPVIYLMSNIAKLGIWAFYFVLAVIAIIIEEDFVSGIIPAALLLAITLTTFVYACLVTHRWRRERKYGVTYEPENRTEVSQYS